MDVEQTLLRAWEGFPDRVYAEHGPDHPWHLAHAVMSSTDASPAQMAEALFILYRLWEYGGWHPVDDEAVELLARAKSLDPDRIELSVAWCKTHWKSGPALGTPPDRETVTREVERLWGLPNLDVLSHWELKTMRLRLGLPV